MTPEAAMARAIELATNGFPAPNPRVGCVITKGNQLIGEGWHEFYGGQHAETSALSVCGPEAEGADVYVTLEPCNHQGRTPPCSEALIKAGVARVTYAVKDPNPLAEGGAERLRSAGIIVQSGLLEVEASAVNEQFLLATHYQRPFVTVKVAITKDGFAARTDGTSKWITGEAARADGHRLRAERGCVLVGRGTVQADDPLLTARIPGVTNQPTRVVIDPNGRLQGTEKVFGADAPTIWLRSDRCDEGPEISSFDVADILANLYLRGIRGVLVEGGPDTISRFLRSGLVDEIVLYQAPIEFGDGLNWSGGVAPKDLGFQPRSEILIGGDVRRVFRQKQ